MSPASRRQSPGDRKRIPVHEPIVASRTESFLWRCDDYPLSWSVWNSHPECEIHLLTASSGTAYVGDHIGPFAPGDLYVVGRNLPHDWVTPLPRGGLVERRDVLVQVEQERLLGTAGLLPEMQRAARLFQLAERGLLFHGEARRIGAGMLLAMEHETGLTRLSLLLALIDLLSNSRDYTVLSSAEFAPSGNGAVNEILSVVLRRLATVSDRPVRLSEISASVGMTETGFSRFFKRHTGNTFVRHLSELRVARACQLLAETDKAMTTICHEVGYVNLSNFNKTFRTLRGLTPSAYRRLAQRTGAEPRPGAPKAP